MPNDFEDCYWSKVDLVGSLPRSQDGALPYARTRERFKAVRERSVDAYRLRSGWLQAT